MAHEKKKNYIFFLNVLSITSLTIMIKLSSNAVFAHPIKTHYSTSVLRKKRKVITYTIGVVKCIIPQKLIFKFFWYYKINYKG